MIVTTKFITAATDALLDRPGVLRQRRHSTVHRAGLRLAGHLPAEPRRRLVCGSFPTSRSRSRHRATAAGHTRSGSVPGSATPTASRCAPATSVARSSGCSASVRQAASSFEDIVGAAACARIPASCDLSRGIVTDDATGTVDVPPHRARPRVPVQADPVRVRGADPARHTRPRNRLAHRARHRARTRSSPISTTEIRFVRNPFFREWSHAAQPDGNPTRSCGEPCRPRTTP